MTPTPVPSQSPLSTLSDQEGPCRVCLGNSCSLEPEPCNESLDECRADTGCLDNQAGIESASATVGYSCDVTTGGCRVDPDGLYPTRGLCTAECVFEAEEAERRAAGEGSGAGLGRETGCSADGRVVLADEIPDPLTGRGTGNQLCAGGFCIDGVCGAGGRAVACTSANLGDVVSGYRCNGSDWQPEAEPLVDYRLYYAQTVIERFGTCLAEGDGLAYQSCVEREFANEPTALQVLRLGNDLQCGEYLKIVNPRIWEARNEAALVVLDEDGEPLTSNALDYTRYGGVATIASGCDTSAGPCTYNDFYFCDVSVSGTEGCGLADGDILVDIGTNGWSNGKFYIAPFGEEENPIGHGMLVFSVSEPNEDGDVFIQYADSNGLYPGRPGVFTTALGSGLLTGRLIVVRSLK